MVKSNFERVGEKAAISMAGLVACTTPAWATITYDYAQDWMFDSASGLYWQVSPISTSTFVPSTGTIATSQQIADLGVQVGLTTGGLLNPNANQLVSAYSLPLANLLSFFQWDAPARSTPVLQHNLSVDALYDDAADGNPPPDKYNYAGFR